LGTSLVVWQTAAVHEQIERLLSQLRAGSGERKSVSIDARWLLLDSEDLDRLMPTETASLDRKLLAAFTRRPSSIRGLTQCFSGQLVYLVGGTRRNFVSSYIPVVGSVLDPQREPRYASLASGARLRFVSENRTGDATRSDNVGYQPVVERPNFGAQLEIRPTLMRDNKSVVVDLKSTFTAPAETGTQEVGQGLSSSPPVVDRFAIEAQELATTLRVAVGEPTLVGGLTLTPSALARSPDAGTPEAVEQPGESAQLYLILNVKAN
jgi:hypothetical protein